MTEDERAHLLSTVGQAHAGLSEVALMLRLGLSPKTPVLKTAIKARAGSLRAQALASAARSEGVLSVLVAGLEILRRRVPLLVTAAVLVGPASLYLAASPGFGLVGLTPIAAYLLASAAIRRDRLKGWRNARGGHSRRCVREIIEPVTAQRRT